MAQFINQALPQHQSLLLVLPGELRNRIYEAYLASTLDPMIRSTSRTVLAHAHNELFALHREANRWFWGRTNPIYPAAHTILDPIKDIALDHVGHMEFIYSYGKAPHSSITFVVLRNPGLNGKKVLSEGRTTGMLDDGDAAKTMVTRLAVWQDAEFRYGKRVVYMRFHETVNGIVEQCAALRRAEDYHRRLLEMIRRNSGISS
ncbi:hypothetical protein B0A48_03495 [Cryoendolithus antarcticus]|uniref:Uncharacterized protein n=1 Tax=Cryoendolithus antarcticus TaxID=1507870 RepID=A0A1V8TKK3_9PEZI|nr:hypothetical protein B0A48_03495 [Cryoendolithus antarcticus]